MALYASWLQRNLNSFSLGVPQGLEMYSRPPCQPVPAGRSASTQSGLPLAVLPVLGTLPPAVVSHPLPVHGTLPPAIVSHPANSRVTKDCAQIGSSPVWLTGTGLSDEDEQTLVNYVGSSIRDSTKKTYSGYWRRFKDFCNGRNVSILPANPAVVARFLIYIAELNASVSGAKLASSSISYFHKLFMGENVSPTDSVIVKNVMKAITEKFSKPVKKAKPFSSELLKDLLDYHFNNDVRSKDDCSVVIMISVMFCLMARHEEVSKLTKDCVIILESGDVEVNFPSAKNYIFSDAKKSFIAFCPNAKYNIAKLFSDYISSLPSGSILFPYSYNSALIKVRKLLRDAGISSDDSFTLHSFRVGSVSEAMNGGLISDSDVQRHARWNSVEMMYRYRCQTLQNQLKASRMLLISRI